MFAHSIPRRSVIAGLIGSGLTIVAACSEGTAPSLETQVVASLPATPAAPVAILGATSDMLVFERQEAGAPGIYVANPDGTGVTKLHQGESPSWSPDHSKIAFVFNKLIFVMNADGTGATAVTSVAPNRSPSFTPDGQKIVFVRDNARGQSDIFTVNVDGSNEKVLVRTGNASESSPRFSPDGTKLAYATTRRGETDVVVQDLASGRRNTVAGGPNPQLAPTWSPDGKRLAFSTGSGNAEDCIAIVNADGTNRKNFPSGVELCAWPSWSPDGTELAFVSVKPELTNVFRGKVDVAGPATNATLPTAGVVDRFPVWSR